MLLYNTVNCDAQYGLECLAPTWVLTLHYFSCTLHHLSLFSISRTVWCQQDAHEQHCNSVLSHPPTLRASLPPHLQQFTGTLRRSRTQKVSHHTQHQESIIHVHVYSCSVDRTMTVGTAWSVKGCLYFRGWLVSWLAMYVSLFWRLLMEEFQCMLSVPHISV